MVFQSIGSWENSTHAEHVLDPFIDHESQVRVVEILQPDRPSMQHQQGVVAHGARPEAAREREMHPVADLAAFPFVAPQRLRIEWHPTLLIPAATTAAVLPRANHG